ncbi:MAG TPA: STELLO glycosyltransferase family protein [Verrucomicrobiae bacterium]|nr:STELLO glycosyltransferase family protein [Verrucomicrobiae bacterium]
MHVVVTTIFPPSQGAKAIAEGLSSGALWVIGDRPGPKEYPLPGTRFIDIGSQLALPFQIASLLPERHYARKNLGYLLAASEGARSIVETDDDNIPLPDFWRPRNPRLDARLATGSGWVNAYGEFAPGLSIWPRGFPLEMIRDSNPVSFGEAAPVECLIQQGLANGDPDVDAIYRLVHQLPVDFVAREAIALGPGCWCPFNSQNTTFFQPAFPLMYLPSFCSFRMTDIWRSLVAQRCLWEMDSRLAFQGPTMYQNRNEHRLLQDFEQEIPGYLNNDRIRRALEKKTLDAGRQIGTVCQNLLRCYEALVEMDLLPDKELDLVRAWIADISGLNPV